MCQQCNIESLATALEPDWVEGQPLPEGLSEHDFERMVKGANAIRLYRDHEWYHYADDDFGFAGLGHPNGDKHLELILTRNKKHKPGVCPDKTCAEAEAARQALLHGIRYFRFSTLLNRQRPDDATGRNWDRAVICGQCRFRNWNLDGAFREDTMMFLGRPYYENSGLPLMGWRFGRLIKFLGYYEGYWHADE